jgi:hypothetical protein
MLGSNESQQGLGSDDEQMLLPVRHQETLTALLHFIGRMVVSEQKIETAQDAGCDAEHCNQERYSGHGYPSARVCHPLSDGNDQKRRAPVDCSVFKLQWRSECVKRDGTASPAFVMTFGPAPAAIRNRLVARGCSEHHARLPKPGTIRGSSRPANGQNRRMKLSSSRGALQFQTHCCLAANDVLGHFRTSLVFRRHLGNSFPRDDF